MSNHLAGESSPYLLQHADNPVDWYPWGEEVFRRARDENKPVFLSIGYSACHWCHVMERESFTDADTAALLNAHFVSIKVDREERPDLDSIYMEAVTGLTGQGGWPLSVWLTPDAAPFYGGTYYPPLPRYGRPSFRQVLEAIVKTWTESRDEVRQAARSLLAHLSQEAPTQRPTTGRAQVLAAAAAELRESADPLQGGWGGAPKFPQPLALEYLLARECLSPQPLFDGPVTTTLDAMAAGGMYDHLGGGFHRYSTDDLWLVPHFEKMLYDNALLARCYLHAWQATGTPAYRRVAEETLDYLVGRMRHPRGGFFSAEDADSDGVEGAFYVWTPAQIREVLPADEAASVEGAYGVSAQGNFEGANILHLPRGLTDDGGATAAIRAKLLQARERRVPPARDEKVLAGWNGLTLAALAEAASALGSEHLREVATQTGRFIAEELLRDGDRLAHSWKDGRASGNGFLEDYACVAEGLLAVYRTTFDEVWFAMARRLVDSLVTYFRRPAGGFYDTSSDHETLIVRPRSVQDSPTPSGNSMAATVLLKMAAYTGAGSYWDLADETLASAGPIVERAPVMASQWLTANLLAETGLDEVAVIGDLSTREVQSLLAVITSSFRPALVVGARQTGSESLLPILQDREPPPGVQAAAWVCRSSTCAAPTSDPTELAGLLARG
ncbi:MAG: thioredoxin domain-containing protein [Thermoleophilia bacterium]|nr:thioredoxin domain-containing protein [Thermoleophilia bacterium]